jgi:hypothetical protein
VAHLEINAIRLSGGTRHEHITHIFGPAFGEKTREQGVKDIQTGTNSFFVGETLLTSVPVRVVRGANALTISAAEYLRTQANGKDTDNLLHLPKR